MSRCPALSGAALLLASALALSAAPALASEFHYALANHPDGNAQLPLYGLRLDELFDVTGGHDIFSFDFDDAQSSMTLVYDDGGTPGNGALGDDSVQISGTVYGGLDTGSSYGNALWAGLWSVSFTYSANLTSGGTQIEVSPESGLNSGSITPLFAPGGNAGDLNVPITLFDKQGANPFSFRFNNTDDHRLAGHGLSGPETFVGWGWLMYEGGHVESSDWLFTAQAVPEPGSALLIGLGLALVTVRIRRAN